MYPPRGKRYLLSKIAQNLAANSYFRDESDNQQGTASVQKMSIDEDNATGKSSQPPSPSAAQTNSTSGPKKKTNEKSNPLKKDWPLVPGAVGTSRVAKNHDAASQEFKYQDADFPVLDESIQSPKSNTPVSKDDYFSCTVHGEALEEKITTNIKTLMIEQMQSQLPKLSSDVCHDLLPQLGEIARETADKHLKQTDSLIKQHLESERHKLSDDMARKLLPQLEIIVADSCKTEMDKFIEEVKTETQEEKVLAVTHRMHELSGDMLQRIFLQRSVVDILKSLVTRLEVDLAMKEWEEL